jgi:hypothetical protein
MIKKARHGMIEWPIGRTTMPNGSKFANELMFGVKGQLIPDAYTDSDIRHMEKSYLKRLWGNCERLPRSAERFELAWRQANGQEEIKN